MQSYKEFYEDQLDEGTLRTASALVLFNRIRQRSAQVHKTDDLNTQLRAIASQNTHLAAMVFAMTQLLPKTKGRR